MMGHDRGFTPRQRRELEELLADALAAAPSPCPRPSDPRRIEFTGSLDSRALVGNIVDGIVHYALEKITEPPSTLLGKLAGWVGLR